MAKNIANSSFPERAAELIRGGIIAALLPLFFLYVFLDKPDYKIAEATAGVIVPVAKAAGDILTWPVRAAGNVARGLRELGAARRENEELRARLDDALRTQHECEILAAENQRLERLTDMGREFSQKTIMARAIIDNSAFSHHTFMISKGADAGIKPGQAVLSSDGFLAGVIIDVYSDFARARALSDVKSSVPLRVAGSSVYGFLTGAGASQPIFEFFSDQEFIPTVGIKLLSSGIKGNLPSGIPVGAVVRVDKKSAYVKLGADIGRLHDVIILEFDGKDGYK